MRKILCVAVLCCIVCFSSCFKGSTTLADSAPPISTASSTPTETPIVLTTNTPAPTPSTPIAYPLDGTSKYYAYATEPPLILYTTPASENGLKGNPYYVTGVVTEVIDSADLPSDRSAADARCFTVLTDSGSVMFTDFAEYSTYYVLSSDSDELADYFSNYFTDGTDYTFPSVGEYVTVYGFYVGYSNKSDMPVFYYGLSEILYDFAFSNDDESVPTPTPDPTSTPEPTSEPTPTPEPTAEPTTGERNALRSAKDYLSFMSFSRSGLIDQLEYEGFSYDEAVYAVDNCGADWYEQASKKAAEYLDFTSFSRSGLIDQLEYEGFTYDQAVYGVEQQGY